MLFSLTLVCVIVGGLYLAKAKKGPFAHKSKSSLSSAAAAPHSGSGDGFLDPKHGSPKKTSSGSKKNN
jgi:hypothetical protein